MDITPDQIQKCVEDIKDRVNKEYSSGVKSVIGKILKLNPKDVQKNKHHLIEKVTAAVTHSGEYMMRDVGNDHFISKNPNWTLNQNLILTNQSLQSVSNITIPEIARIHRNHGRWSLGIAAATGVFIGLTYLSTRKNDKSAIEFKDLPIEVRNSLQSLQHIDSSLKEINSSIRKLKMDSIKLKMDSLSVRLKK